MKNKNEGGWGDPFIKAQDIDVRALNSLLVKKNSKNHNYIVSYNYERLVSLNPRKIVVEKVIINIKMKEENCDYKIEDIW